MIDEQVVAWPETTAERVQAYAKGRFNLDVPDDAAEEISGRVNAPEHGERLPDGLLSGCDSESGCRGNDHRRTYGLVEGYVRVHLERREPLSSCLLALARAVDVISVIHEREMAEMRGIKFVTPSWFDDALAEIARVTGLDGKPAPPTNETCA